MPRLQSPITREDHIRGLPEAPLVLVQYGDFECPNCGAAYPIVQQVREYFGDDLLFCYRHFPLIETHPNAMPAAESSEWADMHKRFWEMHDLLFENQSRLSPLALLRLAADLKLNSEELASSLEDERFRPRVVRDMESGAESGVQGPPAFFINGEQHAGSYTFDDLVDAIEQRRFRIAG